MTTCLRNIVAKYLFLVLAIYAAIIGTDVSAQSGDAFFPKPIFGQPSLSTDGSRVAVIDYRNRPRTQLLTLGFSESDGPVPIDMGELDPVFARWVGEKRLMVYAVKRQSLKTISIDEENKEDRFIAGNYEGFLIFIDSDGRNRVDVTSNKVDPRGDGFSLNDFSWGSVSKGYVGLYVPESSELFKVNVTDGTVKKVASGNYRTLMIRLTSDGSKGLKVSQGKKPGSIDFATPGGTLKFLEEDLGDFNFERYGHDGETLYASIRNEGEDKTELYKIGPKKRIEGPLASHDKLDFRRTHATRDGRIFGGIFSGGPFEHMMFDAADQTQIRSIHKFLGKDSNPLIVDASADNSKWLIHMESPSEPGAYFLYDKTAGRIDHLLDQSAPVDPTLYSEVEVFGYTARDGMALFGYLTESKAANAQTPLLVFPHGGPHSQDDYGFDNLAQYFASRGYRVFQPQFRGSTGQGAAFQAAGFKEWGGLMQDDITDGVEALLAAGKARKGRIAIAGISYGGYAALWGALHQDDLYATAIAVNPASDIADQIDWFDEKYSRYRGYQEKLYSEWGHPEEDAAYLAERSPINAIDKLKIPLLLIHGTNDETVPIRQSRALAKAAEKANVSIKYIEVERAGHSLESDVGEYTLGGDQVDYFEDLKITLDIMTTYLDEAFSK